MIQQLKDNLFIVLGIALPVLLIASVLAVRAVTLWSVADPQLTLLYIENHEKHLFSLSADATRGTVRIDYKPDEDEYISRSNDRLIIHLFHPGKSIDLPREAVTHEGWDTDYQVLTSGHHIKITFRPDDYDTSREAKLAYLGDRLRHSDRTAPDGYSFRERDYEHRHAMMGIFSPGIDNSRYILEKGARQIAVPAERGHHIRFLGWLSPGKEDKT